MCNFCILSLNFNKISVYSNTKNFRRILMAYVISNECIECGTCLPECPVEAISEGSPYTIDASKCTDCGACADVCPSDAISPA